MLAACQSSQVRNFELPTSAANAQPTKEYKTLDENYIEISERIPGFAGVYEGNDGVLVAKIAPSEQQPSPDAVAVSEVRDAIVEVLGTEWFTDSPNETVTPADPAQPLRALGADLELRLETTKYTFKQLKTWFLQVVALDLDGVIMYDANEGSNNVYLGVETEAQAVEVRARVAALSFPSDAVEVEVIGPFDDLVLDGAELEAYRAQQQAEDTESTLAPMADQHVEGYNDPLVGGIEIQNNATGQSCTYGFSARRNGVYGFVTNSHCTRFRGQVNGDEMRQVGSLVGYETADTRVRGCGLIWQSCYDADAAFFRHVNRAVVPAIAGTGPEPGDKVYSYRSKVLGSYSGPAQGQHYIAVTATTGFTRLIAQNTCTFLRVSGDGFTVECGATATPEPGYPFVQGGDSGSPVITRNASGAVLAGQVFGGNGFARTVWMNNMSGIYEALGNMAVTW